MQSFTHLEIGLHRSVATVTMNRPAQRNAFNAEMIGELTAAFAELGGSEDVRVVILAGAGSIFSAGADVAYMHSIADFGRDENVADAMRLAGLFAAVRDCPKPVIARIQGAAIGGGAGLVAACDIAVAAEGAKFAFSEARLGIVPAVISPFVIPRIGVSAARELFLTGERFDAAHALRIGLVHRVVAAGDLDAAVDERVEALLMAAPGSQAVVKKFIPVVAANPVDVTQITAGLIAERRASAEGREGLSAFLEGRRAEWVPEPAADKNA